MVLKSPLDVNNVQARRLCVFHMFGCSAYRMQIALSTSATRDNNKAKRAKICCTLPLLLSHIMIWCIDIAVVTPRCQTREALTNNTVSITLAHVPALAVCSFTLPPRTPVHQTRYPRPRSRPGDGPALSSRTRSVLHTFHLYLFTMLWKLIGDGVDWEASRAPGTPAGG